MSEKKQSYTFGPVPSRRLGLSLGIDIVPFKSCTQDCIYCQLGKAPHPQTIERKSFVPIDDVIAELKEKIDAGVKADYITISGSGEPTLNSDLAVIIEQINAITDIPVAIITNGTLLYLPHVRKACERADLVVPSLDACDEEVFNTINQPHKQITFARLVEGLKKFKHEYKGKFWLEVFLVDGINTSDEQLAEFKNLIAEINPDKVQLNTAVRPTAKAGIMPVSAEKLAQIAQKIGHNAGVIADFDKLAHSIADMQKGQDAVYEMLKRRPCSLNDISIGLGMNRNEALKYITTLVKQDKITAEQVADKTFYKAI